MFEQFNLQIQNIHTVFGIRKKNSTNYILDSVLWSFKFQIKGLLFVTSSSVISVATFTFVVWHGTNPAVFTVNRACFILAIWAAESMRAGTEIVTNTDTSVATLRLTGI